jgi:hypothetical protein
MQATYTGFETITEANVFKVRTFCNFETCLWNDIDLNRAKNFLFFYHNNQDCIVLSLNLFGSNQFIYYFSNFHIFKWSHSCFCGCHSNLKRILNYDLPTSHLSYCQNKKWKFLFLLFCFILQAFSQHLIGSKLIFWYFTCSFVNWILLNEFQIFLLRFVILRIQRSWKKLSPNVKKTTSKKHTSL